MSWIRVEQTDKDTLSVLNLSSDAMSQAVRVSLEDAPEWMLTRLAILTIAPEDVRIDGIGFRTKTVFYVIKSGDVFNES